MIWNADIAISRESSVDDGLGGTEAGAPEAVLEARCAFADGGRVIRTRDGAVIEQGDAVAYLPDTAGVTDLKVGDDVAVTLRVGHGSRANIGGVIEEVLLVENALVISRT